MLFVQALLSLYLGINWGFEIAGSPGGKAVLSVVGVVFAWIVCVAVDVLAIWIFSPRRTTSPYASYRPVSSQTREEAMEAFRQRSVEKKQALQAGVTPEAFEAEQYERSRQKQQAHDDEFSQRPSRTKPLPPTSE